MQKFNIKKTVVDISSLELGGPTENISHIVAASVNVGILGRSYTHFLVRLHCFHREPVYKYKYCLHENEDKNEEKQIVFLFLSQKYERY